MNTVITVLQVFIGFLMTVGGLAKLVLPYSRYSNISAVAWSKEFKPAHLHLLGVLEIMAGVGLLLPLVLPSLTGIAPLSAVGVALYMSGAMATHLRRSEYVNMVGNFVVFLAPALLVAYARLIGFAV